MNIAPQAQEFLYICARRRVNIMTELASIFQFISTFSTSSVPGNCFFCVCVCWKWQVPDSHIAALEKLRGPSWPCFYWPPHHVYLHQLAEWETCNGCPCRNQVQVLWLSEGDSHLKTWNFTKFNADEFKNLVAKKWSTPNGYEINNYIHGPLGIWWICEGFPSPLNMFTNKFPF